MTTLSPFDDRDVANATIAVTNAGDGLSKALEVQPQEFHHGDTVHVVLRCTVKKVRFDEDEDSGELTRVHILKAGTSTIVDEQLVRKVLADQEKAIEAAKGILKLGDGETDGD